jgi:Uma2 family endonuclease
MVASTSKRQYTLADYLAVEEMSAVRHEYLDGEIFAMAGGTPEHAALAAAMVVLLGKKLEGDCRPYSADLRIRVEASGLATYADATVICGDVQRDPTSPTHVTNPSVVVEVLSASTEAYDRGDKREHYQRIPTLEAYVLVAQDRKRVEVFSRRDEGAWEHRVSGAGEPVTLGPLGLTFTVDELYAAAGLAAL